MIEPSVLPPAVDVDYIVRIEGSERDVPLRVSNGHRFTDVVRGKRIAVPAWVVSALENSGVQFNAEMIDRGLPQSDSPEVIEDMTADAVRL